MNKIFPNSSAVVDQGVFLSFIALTIPCPMQDCSACFLAGYWWTNTFLCVAFADHLHRGQECCLKIHMGRSSRYDFDSDCSFKTTFGFFCHIPLPIAHRQWVLPGAFRPVNTPLLPLQQFKT